MIGKYDAGIRAIGRPLQDAAQSHFPGGRSGPQGVLAEGVTRHFIVDERRITLR
jgi:hypothetical protein